MLFLRLEIDEDLTVEKEPSFAYPVLTDFFPTGRPLPFEAEFRDDEGKRLSCTTLRDDCSHCDPGCWPKHVRQTIGFPAGAREFRVVHSGDVIYREAVPDPPKVELKCEYDAAAEAIHLEWQAIAPNQGQEEGEEPDLWYLVHYRSRGAWRGLGPRTQSTEDVDLKQLSLPVTVPIRVLATSGIATGIAECAQSPPSQRKPPGEGSIVTVGGEPTDESIQLGHVLRVHAIDDGGRSLGGAEIRWYDEAGRELNRGRDLHLNALGAGEHVVHAVAVGTGGRPLMRTFILHRAEPTHHCHLVASHALERRADAPIHRHVEGEMHDH
jgi:hypothetical protein